MGLNLLGREEGANSDSESQMGIRWQVPLLHCVCQLHAAKAASPPIHIRISGAASHVFCMFMRFMYMADIRHALVFPSKELIVFRNAATAAWIACK